MKSILEALEFKKGNPYLKENDVRVHFEYEKYDEQEIKFYFDIYVGKDEQAYRFQLQLTYIIVFCAKIDIDHADVIEKVINHILPSLTELISLLDSLIREERH